MILRKRWVRLQMFALKVLVRCAEIFGAHSMLVPLCSRFISEIGNDGSLKPVSMNHDASKPTILFLNRGHYPGAIQVLASQPNIRCLDLSWEFLRYLLGSFVREPSRKEKLESTHGVRSEFRMAGSETKINKCREKYRAFLRKFLPLFLARQGIDIVFNSDERYRREADFTRVASELGFPHICYPRDSMFIIPSTFKNAVKRHQYLGRFWGDHIVVQNEVTRQVFLQAGYAREDQISVLGCIRMDRFIRRIISGEQPKTNRKMVLLFFWPLDRRTIDGEIIDLYGATKATVRAMVRVAMKRPEVDFVVKLKNRHMKSNELEPLADLVRSISGKADGQQNFRFCADEVPAEDLIINSTVVCSMQSTTVLEAAAAGKPVILPHFQSLRDHSGSDEVLMYVDRSHLFDVPNHEADLEGLILWRLENDHVPEEIQKERLRLFNEHVASLTADATDKFVRLLSEHAMKGRQKRAMHLAVTDKRLV